MAHSFVPEGDPTASNWGNTMAQTINRDAGRDAADKVADTAAEAVGKTAEAVTAATERTIEGARDMAERARRPMVRLMSGQAAPEMAELVGAEADLARFWLDLVREQMQRNIDTMQRLAAVRDWREALEIQNEYIRESMAGMTQGMHRQMDLAGTMTSRLLATGREGLKDAA